MRVPLFPATCTCNFFASNFNSCTCMLPSVRPQCSVFAFCSCASCAPGASLLTLLTSISFSNCHVSTNDSGGGRRGGGGGVAVGNGAQSHQRRPLATTTRTRKISSTDNNSHVGDYIHSREGKKNKGVSVHVLSLELLRCCSGPSLDIRQGRTRTVPKR